MTPQTARKLAPAGTDWNLWPADDLDLGAEVWLTGELWLIDTAGMNEPGARHYFEVVQPQFSAPRRWPVLGDVRQLGLPEGVRKTLLRGTERSHTARMVLTYPEAMEAQAEGLQPQIPFVTVVHQPTIHHPGIPCTVVEGRRGVLAGHKLLRIDPSYRA